LKDEQKINLEKSQDKKKQQIKKSGSNLMGKKTSRIKLYKKVNFKNHIR
jgi:hypothetical protein